MMRWFAGIGSLFVLFWPAFSASCPSGTPLLQFHLLVEPSEDVIGHSVRSVNRIVPGQKLVYAPMNRLSEQMSKAQVALVVAPPGSGASLTVLEPKSALALAEWKAPSRVSIIALVFGPHGLDAKRVGTLFRKDRELVEQLADYAEQTAKTETLLTALASWDRTPTATENLNAALMGFSMTFGRAIPVLDRNAPVDQQMGVLMRALNPALATYDPLTPEPQQRMQQSALLAATVGGVFFGGPVGLAAGGASMFMNLSSMMFPDTDFRSAFAQPGPMHSLVLCARRDRPRSRTRQAFLWAVRVPDADPPSITVATPAFVLAGAKTAFPVRVGESTAWNNLDRARDWHLVAVGSKTKAPVKVKAVPEKESLEIDLTGVAVASGAYTLAGVWDWETFTVEGEVEVHSLTEEAPRIASESRDRLVRGTGRVEIEIQGCDLQFVEKVEIRRAGGAAENVEFSRKSESENGSATVLVASLDTNVLEAGHYTLLFRFPDATVREAPVRILPPHPALEGLPLRVNLGELAQRIRLRGSGLERIERIDSPLAEVELADGVVDAVREAVVRLSRKAVKGDRVALQLRVEGVNQPLAAPGALEVIGPRPRVSSAKGALPGGLGVELEEGELAAGTFAGFSIRAHPIDSQPSVRVECVEQDLTIRAETARLDEPRSAVRLRSAGAGALFLSFDPGAIGQPGCTLTVVVATDSQGASDPFELGRVVRLPRIEGFEVTDQKVGEFGYAATLKGEELEMIERVGWDADFGLPVTEIPVPVAEGGHKQSLQVTVPWPSPAPRAPLYIWLRGEPRGRATNARY